MILIHSLVKVTERKQTRSILGLCGVMFIQAKSSLSKESEVLLWKWRGNLVIFFDYLHCLGLSSLWDKEQVVFQEAPVE